MTHAPGVFALLGNVRRENVCVSFKVSGTRFPYASGTLHLPQGMLKSYVAAMREVTRMILLGKNPHFEPQEVQDGCVCCVCAKIL